jgi:hypothetical protein
MAPPVVKEKKNIFGKIEIDRRKKKYKAKEKCSITRKSKVS